MLGNCDACGFEGTEVQPYTGMYEGQRDKPDRTDHLCALCAGTMTGVSIRYPSQYTHDARILQTICYVGNAILQALQKDQDKEQPTSETQQPDDT